MEYDLLKMCATYFAKYVALKYSTIEQMRLDYPVPPMYRLQGVSVSGTMQGASASRPKERSRTRLEAEVLAAHRHTRESSGSRRLQQHLARRAPDTTRSRITILRTGLSITYRPVRHVGAMSRRVNCYDNAPVESLWGALKNELIYHQRFATREQVQRAITKHIEIL